MKTEQKTVKLQEADIHARLDQMQGWSFERDGLEREFTFGSFPDAVTFVTRLAFEAEKADHHPDLHLSYKRVRVTWSTHSAGGVTEKDFAGASQSDTIAKRLGG